MDAQDPDLVSTMVRFPGEGATLGGYLSRPKAEGRYPGVIVIHENRGLNAHIRGGHQSIRMATQVRELSAAVVFYGRNPSPLDLVRQIACPLLLIYGEDDPFIIGGVPALEASLKRNGKTFDLKIYPKAKHAFHNDTRPDVYDPEASRDAWARTVKFLKRHLEA